MPRLARAERGRSFSCVRTSKQRPYKGKEGLTLYGGEIDFGALVQ